MRVAEINLSIGRNTAHVAVYSLTMEHHDPTLDAERSVTRCLFEPVQEADDDSRCDLSALLANGYHCRDQLVAHRDYEVWSAYDSRADRSVSVLCCLQSDRVPSSEVAEQYLNDWARRKPPLVRCGHGYSSFLVYPLEYGHKLSKPPRKPFAVASTALITATVIAIVMLLSWPGPQQGVFVQKGLPEPAILLDKELHARNLPVSIDGTTDGTRFAWANAMGEVWLSSKDQDTCVYHDPDWYTFDIDIHPSRNEALVVGMNGRVWRMSEREQRAFSTVAPSVQAWYSGDGRAAYIVSRDFSQISKVDLTSEGVLRSWDIAGGLVHRSASSNDVFAYSDGSHHKVVSPSGVVPLAVGETALAFDADLSRDLYVFGTSTGEFFIFHRGMTRIGSVAARSGIYGIVLVENRIYMACVGGVYYAELETPDQVHLLSKAEYTDTLCRGLAWDEESGQLTAIFIGGVLQWRDVDLP